MKKSADAYRERTYRKVAERSGLLSTYVCIRETDLHILAESDVSETASELATQFRLQVERYIEKLPEFGTSLTPLSDDITAPPIIRDMLSATRNAGVGPMAAVAGAISQYVCRGLIDAGHKNVIVENGGDIYLQRTGRCVIAVFAGESLLSSRIGLQLEPSMMPLGVCTSSGTVGHSLSFGSADSVTVLADSAVVADAVATRLGNEVGKGKQRREGVNRVLETAEQFSDIRGVLVICGKIMGAVGEMKLVPLD